MRNRLLVGLCVLAGVAWLIQRPQFAAYTARPLGLEAILHMKTRSGRSASLIVVNGRIGNEQKRSVGVAVCIYHDNRPIVEFSIGKHMAPFVIY